MVCRHKMPGHISSVMRSSNSRALTTRAAVGSPALLPGRNAETWCPLDRGRQPEFLRSEYLSLALEHGKRASISVESGVAHGVLGYECYKGRYHS